jgi:diguanylate cyclase (GGDEF)-like protein
MERAKTWFANRGAWRLHGSTAQATPESAAPPSDKLSARLPLYGVLLLMILAAVGAFLFVRQQQITNGQRAADANARFISASILKTELRPADLLKPVGKERRSQLDQVFAHEVLVKSDQSATLLGANSVIIYSTDHALIGRPGDQAPSPGPGRFQVGAPVDLGSKAPVGTFELVLPAGPIVASAESDALKVAGLLALVMIVLYLSLLPILHVATNRIRRRLRVMQQQVREMEHQAFHDTLTGLANRALFRDRVEQAIRAAKRDGSTVAVMVMDLDRFKEVNDTFGHQSGDQLLTEVAAHLATPLRESDTVARLGGDEFAILAPAVAGPVGALAIAERAVRELQRPHNVSGVEIDVVSSAGVALYPHHGDDVDALLRCADIALYVSKASGAPSLYALEHDHHSVDRLALGAQLRRAIQENEITLHYQPKADFKTGNISSVEALVRWEHPERGLLSPGAFIPVAEHTGLIRPLTSYVLDRALEQWRRWYDQGIELTVAVNITGRDLFDLRFAYEVKDLLLKWKARPSCLELEITEDTVLVDPVRANSILITLHEFGVRLAIDDFGTGNSSLVQLKRLPVEVLKIDRSFVMHMLADENDEAIVRSTIELGHNLGLQVVAEGVESAPIWNRLRMMGCDIGQGYYLSGPLPPDRLGALLSRLPRATGGEARVRPLVLAATPTAKPAPVPAAS